MNIENYLIGFKRYALYEREINPRTTNEIINSVKKLFKYSKASSVKMIDSGEVREFLYSQKQSRLWSARTFRNQRQYLKTFFNYCRKHDLRKDNPVDKIEKPKVPKSLPRFLTIKQVASICTHVELYNWRYSFERYRNKAIFYTLLFTGIRLNELLHLKREDINMDDREIIVKKGKGRKQRMIPIHPKLFPILHSYLLYREKEKKDSIWLFHSLRSSAKISAKTIQLICRKLSAVSGVKFTPHMLRHTYGRICTNSGISIYHIKEMMGHASVATTEIYLSIAKDSLKREFFKAALI